MLHLLIKVMLVMRFDMKGTFCNSKRLFNKSAAWSALADWLHTISSFSYCGCRKISCSLIKTRSGQLYRIASPA